MLIVAGAFELAPEDRDAFVASKVEAMRSTRAENGCLAYAMSADPVDPTKVLLFERWADQAAFDAHMAGVASAPRGDGPAPKGFSIEIYDIEGVRQFG
jgi:quinol monooxygenase YgiN